ncbi:MAG: hypothetical protein ACTSUD_10270, partial [Alphaproteobacteria bacterium]
RLHAPGRGAAAGEARAGWFDRVGRARGVRHAYSDIMGEIEGLTGAGAASDRKLLAAATRLYRWKGEMLDGSERNQGG